MGDASKRLVPGREAMPLSILETARDLARSRTVGTFIDESLRRLEESFAGSLVSFNRIDLAGRTAAVAFRPYRGELDQAVERGGPAAGRASAVPVVHLAAGLVTGADQRRHPVGTLPADSAAH